MSLKRNVLANYASQIYVSLVNIIMVPMYVHYMGAEAYGLVGFYGVLQAWFMLIDIGLSPTMARETARFNGGAIDAVTLRRLLRALESVFAVIAIAAAAAVLAGSDAISSRWVKAEHLPIAEVQRAVMLMGLIVAFRWISGLYRSAVGGFERIEWLSYYNMGVATARFLLVVPVLVYVGASPSIFFLYQLAVACCEMLGLAWQTYRLLPAVRAGAAARAWDFKPIKDVLRFSTSIAFSSTVWVLITQTDKLVLSSLLPLSEYAYFTLAVLVASGVTLASGPISNSILPRLTRLSAANDGVGVIALYRQSTQAVAVISVAASVVLAFFPEQVLWIWTGDRRIALWAAEVLRLYAIGNGVLAVAAFPYYLQYAKGDLRLHMVGNIFFMLVLVPALVAATYKFGAVGAGSVWLGANLLYLLVWVPKIHGRFVKGLHWRWLCVDIVSIVAAAAAASCVFRALLSWPDNRAYAAVLLVALCFATLGAAAAGSSVVRAHLFRRNKTQQASASGNGLVAAGEDRMNDA